MTFLQIVLGVVIVAVFLVLLFGLVKDIKKYIERKRSKKKSNNEEVKKEDGSSSD